MGGKSSTQTSTVTIPPEVLEQYRTVIGRANQITQKPFEVYSKDPTAFVAPLTSTQQAGIANINAMQGMAQPSVEQGQGMIMEGIGAAAPLQYQSLGTVSQGRDIGGQLFGASLGSVAEGRGMGSQLFGESLGTAASGTGAAGDIFGQALPAIRQAAQTGAGYGQRAEPFLSTAAQASTPLLGQGADLTRAGLGAGAGFGALAADYLQGGTQAISPTGFSGEQIDKYMSPYMKSVVEAQQALQAEEAAAQRSALKGQAIASGAFGGDRGGIAQANLARQQSLANQATLANLLQGGYGQALGAFQQQQGVDLAAQQANRAAQQFGSQQAAALGQQLFGQNLAAGSQLANIGQALFGQNITQGQALAGLGQMLYGQGLGAAQAAAGIGTNVAQMKAQEAALQQQAAQGVFGQAAQQAALQQSAAQGVFNQAAQQAALEQAAANNIFNMGAQGGMNYANLGIAGQNAALQGAQAQLGAGQIEQQTEQAAKSAMYNQFLQQQGFPYQQVGFLGNVSMGIGSQSGGTTTTTGGSFSDRRLKEDIRKVGETFDGQPIYSFRYKGDEKSQLGLIAQEVEKMHPDAVGEREGYLTVDYHDATEDAAKRGHFASGGLVPSSMGGAVLPSPYGREGYELGGDTGVYDPGPAPNAAPSIDPRITNLYKKYLFRDPDPAGAAAWQDVLQGGTPIGAIEQQFASSQERGVVNQAPLVYEPTNFGTPAAPVQNRYGFYSAPTSSIGSSFTPTAISQRQQAAATPTASGKGMQSASTYTPSSTAPTATGKGPSTGSAAPAFNNARYGAYTPTATGKGPSTNAYSGTNNMGYSGSPVATGKGPATRGYANGGRIGYAVGGAGELKDYIDMMAGSPKGLAMSHSSIFKIPGERADITKFSEGMVKGRGSNIPQPGKLPEQRNILKEAADTGTNIAKVFELGSRAKTKLEELTAPKKAPSGEGGGSSSTTTPQTTSGAGTGTPKISSVMGDEQFGPNMPGVDDALTKTNNIAFDVNAARGLDSPLPIEEIGDVADGGGFFDSLSSLFAANGGRIKKQMAGAVIGDKDEEGATDPSEGVFKPIGAELDIGEGVDVPKSSFAKDATQKLLQSRGGGGGRGGGGSPLGTVGQVASLGMTAFNVGKAVASFLPMIFSDERLKKHIKPIGRLYDGQTVYRFDMGGETKIGLIAQEVEKEHPDAVAQAGKYKAVDYEMATAKAAKRGHFFGGGVAANDITADPVKQAIQMAALPPSNQIKLPDFSVRDEVVADEAPEAKPVAEPAKETPIITAGLDPKEVTGLKPKASSVDEVYDQMLGIESGKRQFDQTGAVLRGSAGEEGIAQIKGPAAREAAAYLGIEYDPERVRTDEKYNMQLGKAYFNMQLDRFGGDPMLAAAAYNAGPTRLATALKTAEEKGGDFLDYLPQQTVNYLAKLSDAAQGAHARLLERQEQLKQQGDQGNVPQVVSAPQPGLAGATASAAPGLGAAMGNTRDWDLIGTTILPDMVPKSADFWVPLIAAVGGMLGARAPNMANAIGAGLTAGAAAYMKREEFQQEAMKNSLAMIERRFLPLVDNGPYKWLDTMTNRELTDSQYARLISQFPGMPRIGGTLEPSRGGLGATTDQVERERAPAGGLAPAPQKERKSPLDVEPPKVQAPAPAAPGAPAGKPVTDQTIAQAQSVTAEPSPKVEPKAKEPKQPNLGSLEIPVFASQPEADAWVMANADTIFKGVPSVRDPRTYIRRAEAERAKEDAIEARIARISGDPRPAAKEQLAQLRAERTNAEAERSKATESARTLLSEASAMAMNRSKLQMERGEAVEKERELGEVKTEEALKLERGKRDITTETTLREVEPVAGGPKVLRTEKQILDTINKKGSAPSDNPGAGNPVPTGPSADVVSSQPSYIGDRQKAITENEMKMGEQFKLRQSARQRFENVIKIAELYQTGAFAEFKQDAVRYARALGFDIKDTDTANPEAFQKFMKNSVTSIIDNAKNLAGPIAFKELELIGKAVVSPNMEPGAVASLLADAVGLLNYEDQYYKDYGKWRKDNRDNPYPDFDFNVGWVDQNPPSRFIEEARKDIAVLGQKVPAKPQDLVHGQKYIIRPEGNFTPAYWDAAKKGFVTKKPAPLGD